MILFLPGTAMETLYLYQFFKISNLQYKNNKKLTKLYKVFLGTRNELFNYKTYLIFLFASLAISIGLQMILPFPYGLGAALALFIAFPLLLRRRYMNRMRGYGGDSGSGGGGDSLEWVHKEDQAVFAMFALLVITSIKVGLVHDVVQKCNVLIFS